MFHAVQSSVEFPTLETGVLDLWRRAEIYEKSLAQRAGAPEFVFYEGPPTANGMPHPGHCLTRAIKDLFPRYRTMRGYRCQRKAGWDTHGLPVEVEVCKELGIHSKEQIEAYGVEPFIHKCQQSVWRYMKQWERLTERIGFWIHLEEAYVTYHQSYVESVWWALKSLFDQGLLYQGHKIVWWWAQGGTALSSGEVGQGYREVADPSVYVKFPIVMDERAEQLGLDENTSLLVWTTTPWTLPSNQFAAVHPNIDYVSAPDDHGERVVFAAHLLESIAAKSKRHFKTVKHFKGRQLIGLRYRPPFDCFYKELGDLRGALATTQGGLAARRIYHLQDSRLQNEPDAARRLDQLMSMTDEFVYWRVIPAGFVTVESGTGIVHQAPAFGEVDFDVLQQQVGLFADAQGPKLFCPVAPDGKFTDEGPDYCRGRWVKDCDRDIIRDLRSRGLLYHQEQYLHDYPFCWRAEEDPLIQYPRRSWFIRTSRFKEEMLRNNAQINWLPEHIREGRFGNFLETNVDWALSRERYWGTPLPIWVCQQTGRMEAVGSYAELLAKPRVAGTDVWQEARRNDPALVEDLKIHKPYIDAVTYDSPFAPGARMHRVSEVIDCWFDSGAMPFAQWGYPHAPGSRQRFEAQFPADFISEAIDQTRGWFYSQLAISTLLFGKGKAESKAGGELMHEYPHPFRNCIVLGLMLGEDGQKMSKSKRNYREPQEIFDRYGADALRWYFFANQPPWTSIRYSEQAIKDSIPEFLLRLWNVYSFFVIYARIDGFDPGELLPGDVGQLAPEVLRRGRSYRPVPQRSELDRWILSELSRTAAAATERMDAYDNFSACQRLIAFVDALSNWYVRRSRDRFWAEDKHDPDKLDAYWTLYECLLTTTRLVAPFVPFLAEALWQNLAVAGTGARAVESVHLCDYPTGDAEAVDELLSARMNLMREVVSLGRSARMTAQLKVRQPLGKVELILADATHKAWIQEHAALVREELNVKQVEFPPKADQYVSYTVLPDLKRLGPRLGKQLPAVRQALAEADAAALLATLESQGQTTLPLPDGPVVLDKQDVQVRLQARPGWAAAHGPAGVVVLSTEITPELAAEGLARELVHTVQSRRKELGCEYVDRILLGIETESSALGEALAAFGDYIKGETLAVALDSQPLEGVEPIDLELGGDSLRLYLKVVGS